MGQVDFFSQAEEDIIVKAIKKAEKNTSGEIRVHIDSTSEGDPMKEAVETFNELNMYKTEARNGVLFYLSTKTHQFTILGDEGINNVVPANFWESTKNKVISQFKQGEFVKGLVDGIEEAGTQLKTYFEYHSDDINELPDEISKK